MAVHTMVSRLIADLDWSGFSARSRRRRRRRNLSERITGESGSDLRELSITRSSESLEASITRKSPDLEPLHIKCAPTREPSAFRRRRADVARTLKWRCLSQCVLSRRLARAVCRSSSFSHCGLPVRGEPSAGAADTQYANCTFSPPVNGLRLQTAVYSTLRYRARLCKWASDASA